MAPGTPWRAWSWSRRRWPARAHLLEKTGGTAGAYELYRRAAKATASIAEQRYLQARASRVRPP
jgi:predicted RNA polymerase sigma factor